MTKQTLPNDVVIIEIVFVSHVLLVHVYGSRRTPRTTIHHVSVLGVALCEHVHHLFLIRVLVDGIAVRLVHRFHDLLYTGGRLSITGVRIMYLNI